MKTNERKIAFISFQKLFRIGTFQWVTADSNKKILSAISGCARRFEVNFDDVRLLLVGSLSTAGFDPATANGIAQISLFAKDMRWFSVDLHSVLKKAGAEDICAIKKRACPRRQTAMGPVNMSCFCICKRLTPA
jgi:hypothetical protein